MLACLKWTRLQGRWGNWTCNVNMSKAGIQDWDEGPHLPSLCCCLQCCLENELVCAENNCCNNPDTLKMIKIFNLVCFLFLPKSATDIRCISLLKIRDTHHNFPSWPNHDSALTAIPIEVVIGHRNRAHEDDVKSRQHCRRRRQILKKWGRHTPTLQYYHQTINRHTV